MARPPRIDFPGARHHVMNRGARHDAIFVDDATCSLFIDILAELPRRYGTRVHAWALMPNHYHLLVESPRGNLSEAMRHLQAHFTLRLNALHPGWDGPVFRGRFHNRLVDRDDWWVHLLAYLHLNPVEAHLAPNADLAHWTSHAAYVGLAPRPDWLYTAELLDLLGGVEAYRAYLWEVQVGRAVGPDDFDPDCFRSAAATALAPPQGERAPTPVLAPSLVLAEICAVTGAPRPDLSRTIRGPVGNPARWLAAWWLVYGSGLLHHAVGELLGGRVASVGRWLKFAEKKRRQDPSFEAWHEEVERRLRFDGGRTVRPSDRESAHGA